MHWRRYIRFIHRDLGYLTFFLVIIYSVSGIAVNHVDDWNPNYIIFTDTLQTQPLPDTIKTSAALNILLPYLGKIDTLTGMFRRSKVRLDIFYDGKTASAQLDKGFIVFENVENRSPIRESNFLHLNTPKKLWTYVADGFAVALILLSITGLFIIKGKKGITGRGKWLTIAGILIPIIFLLIYF